MKTRHSTERRSSVRRPSTKLGQRRKHTLTNAYTYTHICARTLSLSLSHTHTHILSRSGRMHFWQAKFNTNTTNSGSTQICVLILTEQKADHPYDHPYTYAGLPETNICFGQFYRLAARLRRAKAFHAGIFTNKSTRCSPLIRGREAYAGSFNRDRANSNKTK